MGEIWNFLDEFDGNLLFSYIQSLRTPKVKFVIPYSIVPSGNAERDELNEAELFKKTALYLYWFVYRYILNCQTLEEALVYADKETLKTYKLSQFLESDPRRIYIGVYGKEIYLCKLEDISVILEILYNRYDFFEQLECFCRNASPSRRAAHNCCKRTLEQGRTFLEKRGMKQNA